MTVLFVGADRTDDHQVLRSLPMGNGVLGDGHLVVGELVRLVSGVFVDFSVTVIVLSVDDFFVVASVAIFVYGLAITREGDDGGQLLFVLFGCRAGLCNATHGVAGSAHGHVLALFGKH